MDVFYHTSIRYLSASVYDFIQVRVGGRNMKATLFSFNVYLRQDGKVELDKQMDRQRSSKKKWTPGCPIMMGHTP